MSRSLLPLAGLSLLALSACSGSDPVGQAAPAPGSTPKDRYSLANACFALKSGARQLFALRAGDGSYAATAPSPAASTPFFMKPTALGKYLFFAPDQSFLAVTGSSVGSVTAPGDAADWTVMRDAAGNFTATNQGAAKSLAVDPATGQLILADSASGAAAQFDFVPASGCTPFPEITTNSSGTPFKGRGIDQPALGFADVHLHVSATNFLGGAHYGAPFHRFGVTQALGSCEVAHGPDGHEDFVGNLYGTDPLGTHDTTGWPTFVDWPAAHSLTHEATYYKWVERAWRAGLRILLNNLVDNQTLCTLNSTAHVDLARDCNEMNNAVAQAQTMRNLQDYVDAQEGGPGKGWFRIVTSPAEARAVINDGKLAVVLGVEISHLFDCSVQRIAGVEMSGCTQQTIDTEIDELYNLGVRQMFPIHEFDNALGGNGIFDGTVLNIGNRADTGQFWSTYACPDGGEGDSYLFTAGAVMTGVPAPSGNPVGDALIAATAGQAPVYGPGRQCNARLLTDLGRYAIGRMMDKKIIVEVDHLELKIKDQVIEMAQARTPPYPVVSTHGGHGGITMEQAKKILALGGIIYPMHPNGQGFVSNLARLESIASFSPYFAVGYGADTNGMASQANPRSGDFQHVTYPFTLFSGPDWGPEFAGIAPVSFGQQVSGERVYDTDIDGMAHYGMIADWVEEVRIEGHRDGQANDALHQLYRSAEAYLQMWERTVNR